MTKHAKNNKPVQLSLFEEFSDDRVICFRYKGFYSCFQCEFSLSLMECPKAKEGVSFFEA